MKNLFTLTFFLTLSLCSGSFANAQKIMVSWAGNGSAVNSNDGYAGYITQVSGPTDVCLDAAHNLYFIEAGSLRIRKVAATNGLVTTVAGGGTSFADGVPAITAALSLSSYSRMCIDASGNLYFTTSTQIKKVNIATGIITTIAGTSVGGYSGDGGAAISATLGTPAGICIDAAGNIYVVDNTNNCIRKIKAATGIITTVVGDGTGTGGYTGDGGVATAATLSSPIAMCINASGDLFFSDQSGSFIRQIHNGIISTIAGNGGGYVDSVPATNSGIGDIYGMCCDGSGNIFIDDASCSCREINMATGIINTVAGSLFTDGYSGDGLNALSLLFNFPMGVCVDAAGSIYVADNGNNRIRKAIQITHAPSFANGRGQYIYPCSGTPLSISGQMAVTDLDSAQTETWTVISAPANGSLSGFPYSAPSLGVSSLVTPAGVSYAPHAGFSGTDFFKVRVTDGALSDTVTIYVSIPSGPPDAGTISQSTPGPICAGSTVSLSETVPGGAWSITNTINGNIDGSGNFSGYAAGNDTVIYTVFNGCISSTETVITVNAQPDAGVVSGNNFVLPGATTTLNETVPGGAWSSYDITIATVSPTGVVYGVSVGYTYILYTVTDGTCSNTIYYQFSVQYNVGVNNVANTIDRMVVSPNPSHGNFTINISSSTDEEVTITIANILGEQVKTITGTTNKPIPASLDVAPGMYLLDATGAHGKMTYKIVVQ